MKERERGREGGRGREEMYLTQRVECGRDPNAQETCSGKAVEMDSSTRSLSGGSISS